MKKILIYVLIILSVNTAVCYGITYYDDPISVGIGARPVSMGKAFIAITDDPNAIFLNPAGLGTLKAWELSTTNSNFLDEYQYTMFCGVNPTPSGVFGIGYVSSRIGGIIVSPGITTDFYNQATVLSYGSHVGDILSPLIGEGHNIYSGATFKYYSKGFTGGVNASGSGYNFDLGLLYLQDERISYGLAVQNVLTGSQILGDFDPEIMPFVTKIGASYHWLEQDVKVALDKDMYLGRENYPWPMHFGAEWRAHKNLLLRTGLDQVASTADGGDLVTNTTFGLGFEYSGIKADISYTQNYAQTNLASNVISLSFYSEPLYAQEAPPRKEAPPKKVETPPTPEAVTPPPMPIVKPVTVEPVPVAKTVDKKISFTPSGNLYTYNAQQVYSGNVDFDITDLWISGKKVGLRSDRAFAVSVPLNIGKNEILVRLRDTSSAEADIMTKTIRFYLPTDLSYDDVNSKYFEYKVIYTELYKYLGKDYNTNKKLTREILALIITKAKKLNISPSQDKVSMDVNAIYWAAKYIRAVKYVGIMNNFSDGTFRPDKLVTRAELARIMGKATGIGEATTLAYLTGRLPEEAAALEDLAEIIYRSGMLREDVDDYKAFIGYESSMM